MKRNLLLLTVSTLARAQNPPTMFPPARGTRATVGAPQAIELADGLALPEIYASCIRMNQRILDLWPASRAFFRPNGAPPNRGEMFRAPTLAKTLRDLVAAEKHARGKRAAKIRAVRN